MSTLSNRSLDASYIELLKIDPTGGVNTGISASLANVETGNGTASALRLSTTQVHSTGTLTSAGLATLNSAAVTNNATIGGTLGVTGLLTATGGVSGALTGNVTGNVAGNVTGNVTGNLSGNVNGTVGATTPNSGSFTTLGASGSSTLSSVSATSLTVSGDASFTGSGGLKMPVGATAGATGRPAIPVQGMLRYNTSLNQFEGYDGSSWAPIASGGGGGGGGGQTMYVRQTFTATAGQTTFTITGGYTAYKLDVFQNGVKLVNSDVGISRDVDVSNGSTIVLATGAAVGDVIDVIGLTSGSFAGPATARRQTYTATAGQTVFTVSGGYTVGQLDVFQNGTKLVTAVDVDVGNGSTFTLTTPAVAGDSLEVVGFTAADTVSGTLQFQAGTAAAPSITTFGDTNTGIFFPAGGDTIAFSEGGTEAMRIDSSGKVLINSRGTQRTSNLSLCKLQVYDSSIGLASNSDYTPQAQLFSAGTTAGSAGYFLATRSRGTYEAPTTIQANDFVGNLAFSGYDGTTFYANAGISAYADGAVSTGTVPLALQFSTGSTAGLGRMVITSAGNVGIGTTSPSTKLHIQGAGTTSGSYTNGDADAQTLYLQDTGAAAGNGGQILFGASSGIFAGIKGSLANGNGPAGDLILQTRTISGNVLERLRVDYKGDVGIGTTSPSVASGLGLVINGGASQTRLAFKNTHTGDTSNDGVQFALVAASSSFIFQNRESDGSFAFETNSVERLRIDSSGNVGIGTTSPATKLEVNGSTRIGSGNDYQWDSTLKVNAESTGASGYMRFYTNSAERLRINSGGQVGIGTTAPNARLFVTAGSAPNNAQLLIGYLDGSENYFDANNQIFRNGNAAETMRINSSGVTIATLAGTGSRSVNASAAGLLSAASDASLKEEVVGAHIPGLAEILQIHPKMYRWKDDIANRGNEAAVELGFIANDVAPIIPSAAPMGNDGLYGFYDRSVIAALVKAVQELSAKVTELEAA